MSFRSGVRGKDLPTRQYSQAPIHEVQMRDSGQAQSFKAPSGYGISPSSYSPPLAGGADSHLSAGESSNSGTSEIPYTTVHYYRHLGPTAIAP